MSPFEVAAAIEERLRRLAQPERAVPMQAYLLGQFAFLGLPAPTRRAAVKDLVTHPAPDAAAVLATAEELWRLPEREFRYAAIDVLRHHRRLLRPAHLPAIKRFLLADPWWETVDGLAVVVGAILRDEARSEGGGAVIDGRLGRRFEHVGPASRHAAPTRLASGHGPTKARGICAVAGERPGFLHPQGDRLGAARLRALESRVRSKFCRDQPGKAVQFDRARGMQEARERLLRRRRQHCQYIWPRSR